MGEIKTDVKRLEEGVPYIPGPDEYVITDEHTLNDILRFLISQAGEDGYKDIQHLLNEYSGGNNS